MPSYFYQGKTLSGETVKGTMEADSSNEVSVALRRQNIFPTKIVGENVTGRDIKIKTPRQKVSVKDLSVFCRQFHNIIGAGISLIECLDILRKQTENKSFANIISEVYEDVQKGVSLSASMDKHKGVFPDILRNMVKSGEISGQLDIIMLRMAQHFDKENKLNNKIKSAMIYPIILVSVAVIVCYILLTKVLPGFVFMFAGFGVELPAPTRLLLLVGAFYNKYWYINLGFIGLVIIVFRRFINSYEGRLKFDDFKLFMPIVGNVNRKIATSRFARTLATMLASGIPILDAMELVTKVIGNKSVEAKLEEAIEKIQKGEGIAEPVNKVGIFPPMVISMIRIGEETGSLDNLLETTATFYDEEVEIAIEAMIALINPIILLVMAFVVGGIVMAIALPMFDMYNYIAV